MRLATNQNLGLKMAEGDVLTDADLTAFCGPQAQETLSSQRGQETSSGPTQNHSHPHLDCCAQFWLLHPEKDTGKLEEVQEKMIRTIMKGM